MEIGSRVRLVKPVDNYPTIFVEAGATGTLTRIDSEGCYWVKLDKHYPDLDEWKNEVAIWDWSKEEGPDDHPSTYLALESEPNLCRHRDDGRGRCIDCGAFI